MMKRAFLAGAASLAITFASHLAVAKDLPAGGLTIEEFASWLQKAGYQAQIQTDNSGHKSIASSTGGTRFYTDMYHCTPRCDSLEFYAAFATKGAFNAVEMNQWNSQKRWIRVYVDKSNDPWVEMDVDLSPGGTYEGLADQFGIWRDELDSFRKFIHF